jgi:signal peptidase II
MSNTTRENPTQLESASSVRSLRAWVILLATSILGLIADLWTKASAFEHVAETPTIITREDVLTAENLGHLIPPHDPIIVINNILEFTLVLNPGAVFGIGAGQRWFFIIFTVIAIMISLVLFVKWTRAADWIAHGGFGLIIAGGIGNLYDRLLFACVRDFIHPFPGVKLPFGIRWPGGNDELWPYVSNVADAFLIVGIVMLMIHAWRLPTEPTTDKSSEPK